jgi:hypothetical protein
MIKAKRGIRKLTTVEKGNMTARINASNFMMLLVVVMIMKVELRYDFMENNNQN